MSIQYYGSELIKQSMSKIVERVFILKAQVVTCARE